MGRLMCRYYDTANRVLRRHLEIARMIANSVDDAVVEAVCTRK